MAKPSKNRASGAGCNPLDGTVLRIKGYPDKLIYYKVDCSKFYWARVHMYGRYFTKSLRTESPVEAKQRCIEFFNEKLSRAGVGKGSASSRKFASVGHYVIESEKKTGSERRYYDDFNRFSKELLPFFGEMDVGSINNAKIREFQQKLQGRNLSAATVKHYMMVLKKILRYAADNEMIQAVPNFPRITGQTTLTKRDYFEYEEYKKLCLVAEKLAKDGEVVRGVPVTEELKLLMQFMVNTFIRPSDLRVLRHEHVHFKTNPKAKDAQDKRFLLLKHPKTKTNDQEVVSMPTAVPVYEKHLALMKTRARVGKDESGKKEKGFYGKPKDYVFFPEYKNRTTAMAVIGRQFRKALEEAGLQEQGELHTLYSLRHSSIMYRILKGDVDTLTLAKNARTSQAMIERFYASRLAPLMNIEKLHSFKK